jgi:hypothetical protein
MENQQACMVVARECVKRFLEDCSTNGNFTFSVPKSV